MNGIAALALGQREDVTRRFGELVTAAPMLRIALGAPLLLELAAQKDWPALERRLAELVSLF
jgi:hypothetical protein